jgi:hypothetical protein
LHHSRNTHRFEQGGSKLKAIFWTLVFLAIIFAAFKLVPPFVAKYQLQDRMTNEARFATVTPRTEEQIRNNVFQTIQDLEIPARREDIKIENTGRLVRISVEYTVTVDFILFQTDLHFHPVAENRALI